MPLGGISFLAFDVGSVYVRWIMCGSYRGTWPPTCIACQRAPSRVGSGLSELVVTDSRAPESCAIASRSETSDNFWSGTSTCARANSAKKRAGAVFSGQRAAKQTTYSLNNMARITLIAALFGGAAAQSTVGCVPASAPLVVVFFCARRRLTLPPPAQPLAEDCRLRVGLGR